MNDQLQTLFEKYINNTCSKQELENLFLMVKESNDDRPLEETLKMVWEKTKALNGDGDVDWDNKMMLLKEEFEPKIQVVPLQNKKHWIGWKRFAVAASIVLVLGAGLWIFKFENNNKEDLTVLDIKAPSTNLATIKLSNGEQVYLDDINNGTIAKQGSANVIKTVDGKIIYKVTANENAEMSYNTLVNPRGSKVVDIILSDGTKVWLNAGSTLRFPVAFSGKDRKVSITGEGYFEVAHNAKKPFKVSKADMVVTVLGTHFNVKAYENEPDINVTLLEGAVKAAKQNGQSAVLKPGEQARITNKIDVKKDVDISEVMAWKEGAFRFKETNIVEIMRQISRWYDVDVEYEGDITDLNFSGTVSRHDNLSELLKRLEATEMIKFNIRKKKLYIMPK